jgi:hypothetical protein
MKGGGTCGVIRIGRHPAAKRFIREVNLFGVRVETNLCERVPDANTPRP